MRMGKRLSYLHLVIFERLEEIRFVVEVGGGQGWSGKAGLIGENWHSKNYWNLKRFRRASI